MATVAIASEREQLERPKLYNLVILIDTAFYPQGGRPSYSGSIYLKAKIEQVFELL